MSVGKNLPTPPADAGANAPAPVAGQPASAAPAAVAPGRAPALFGGHRGGGKKRADGLPAGSPEAVAADKTKHAARMVALRAEKKRGAALPSPLPSAGAVAADAPPGDSPGAVDGGAGPVSVVVVGTVVPWKASLLQKPALLLTRILDRWRTGRIFQKLDRAQLPETVAAEIKKDAAWKDSAREDFSAALADAASIELNKRAVSAGQSHWINLSLSAGELALAHYDLCARIDKLVLAAKEQPPGPDGKN